MKRKSADDLAPNDCQCICQERRNVYSFRTSHVHKRLGNRCSGVLTAIGLSSLLLLGIKKEETGDQLSLDCVLFKLRLIIGEREIRREMID